MKATITQTSDIQGSGSRLDAGYHASEGVQALQFLHRWASPKPRPQTQKSISGLTLAEERVDYLVGRPLDLLQAVCKPSGIFIPYRFKRVYVDDPEHGVPYLTGGDILQADPVSGAKLLSRKYTGNLEQLALKERMILITCSGTIGNCVYVNANFEGTVGSPDLIRIIADTNRILPGYLYAYLSSPLGRALIEQKTYGAVIPHIEAHHVLDLPIPRLEWDMEQRIHELIEQAAQLRVEATSEISLLIQYMNEELYNIPPNYRSQCPYEWSYDAKIVQRGNSKRIDAFYFAGHTAEYASFLGKGPKLQEIASVHLPGKFKRMYVGSNGIPYLSGVDVYQMRLTPRLWLSHSQPELQELTVQRLGTILVQADGQRYGLLGRPVYVDNQIVGAAISNHLVRIDTKVSHHAGFVFLFLSTEAGRRTIIRESYGTSIPTIPLSAFQNLVISGIDDLHADRLGIGAVVALEKRVSANKLEDQAQMLLSKELGFN